MLATEMLLSLLAAIPVQSRFDAPPPGLYNCYSMELTGSVGMPASFRLHPDGRYTSGDRTGMGRYHPNERVMEWKGGDIRRLPAFRVHGLEQQRLYAEGDHACSAS